MTLATQHFINRMQERYGFQFTIAMQIEIVSNIKLNKYPCLSIDGTKRRYKINMFGNIIDIIFDTKTSSLITALAHTSKMNPKRIFKKYYKTQNKNTTKKRNYYENDSRDNYRYY